MLKKIYCKTYQNINVLLAKAFFCYDKLVFHHLYGTFFEYIV